MISENPDYMPRRATKGSAGYDFFSPQEYRLSPDEWTVVDTGVRFTGHEVVIMAFHSQIDPKVKEMDVQPYIPMGWYMELKPRSGLGVRYGLKFRNTSPVIDQDYKDTIKVHIRTDVPYTLKQGERFMQGIIHTFGVFSDEIAPQRARKGGFGSTGVKA
jgi:dUTP pyrophosphatase